MAGQRVLRTRSDERVVSIERKPDVWLQREGLGRGDDTQQLLAARDKRSTTAIADGRASWCQRAIRRSVVAAIDCVV